MKNAKKEVNQAEAFLQEAYTKWEVIDVDNECDTTDARKKKRKKKRPESETNELPTDIVSHMLRVPWSMALINVVFILACHFLLVEDLQCS